MLFQQIKGLESTKKQLLKAVQNNHVAHAQLFWGQEGSASLALAWAYATYIHCENKQENGACGRCPACIKSQKLIHPDLNFVFPVTTTQKVKSKALSKDFMAEWREFLIENPYSNLNDWLEKIGADNKQGLISVEESRHIIQNLSMKPFESDFKIMIIWLPEKMNVQSANAILKVLEEPSPKTLFLMVCQEPDKLLATIISRVQALQIPNFTDEELAENLQSFFNIDSEKSQELAYLANGNLNEALYLSQNNQDDTHVFFRDWMRSCYKKDYTDLVKRGNDFAKLSKSIQRTILHYTLKVCRETMLWQSGGNEVLRLSQEKEKFVQGFSKVLSLSKTQFFYEQTNDSIRHLERNASPKIVFTDLSLCLSDLMQMKG